MKILITGATGMIGKELGKRLVEQGHKIFIVSRDPQKAKGEVPFPCEVIGGDLVAKPLNEKDVAEIEGFVHLMGENISSGRWTAGRRKKIVESRSLGTRNLLRSFGGSTSLKVAISTSAVGYYGDRGGELLTEESSRGQGFLADVCKEWEEPFTKDWNPNRLPQSRWAVFRFGVVLSSFGGALEKMMMPFRFGIGGNLGDGKQWLSWIHIQDLVELLATAIDNKNYHGIYNAVSPKPATNSEFTEKLAKEFHSHVGPTVPAAALKLALGEMSTVILASQKVSSEKVQKQGFAFKYPDLASALADVCSYWRDGDLVLRAEQFVKKSRSDLFPFFSSAQNLEKITPPSLNFHVVNMSTPQVSQGTEINYKLKIHGVPVTWKTLIDEWKPGEKFVDHQVQGPYNKWHHTHEFKDLGDGTLMTDTVRYRLPLGRVGEVMAGWLVKSDVKNIFSYRRKYIDKNF